MAAGKSKDNKSTAQKTVVPQIPLAQGPSPQTSDAEIALVRSAIDSLRRGGASKATEVAAAISDPAARKLVEWIILCSDHNGAHSKRYLAFIAANPSWPSLAMFRRRAEAMLWVENVKPAQALSFFDGSPPQSGMGRLVLARALLAQGDKEGASALVREVWRNDPLSAEVEKQVLERHAELLSRADHKARMEKRLFADDNDAALRAARRLGGAAVAIAQARIALDRKPGDQDKKGRRRQEAARCGAGGRARRPRLHLRAGAVSAPRRQGRRRRAAAAVRAARARPDPRSRGMVGRAADHVAQAARCRRRPLGLSGGGGGGRADQGELPGRAPFHGRLDRVAVSRRSGHRRDPLRSHPGREQPSDLAGARRITGSDALRKPPAGRIRRAPSTRRRRARRPPITGSLHARVSGLRTLALAAPPAKPDKRAEAERPELVRALEILYALNERDLAIALMAGIGGTLDDVGTLSALGELAEQREDARGMLQLGKAALGRGLPLDYYAFPAVGVPRYSPIGPGIDNAMLFAIIRQESAFDPADWSHAQAMGLMQVTPEAGRHTCKRFGCTYDVKRLKADSPYNLQVGAAELAGLMQDYRGNYILVFAGYNAGRGRVQEWIARFGDPRDPKVDPVDWVERIPFMETRNYVQRVMENLQVYRTRFGNDAPLTIDADLRRDAKAN